MLHSAKFVISQPADSCQDSEGECQELTVEFDDAGEGFFMRLTTGKQGWSFESQKELDRMLKPFRTAMKRLEREVTE